MFPNTQRHACVIAMGRLRTYQACDLQAALLSAHEAQLPFKAITPSEFDEIKPDLSKVLLALNQKEAAAELARGSGSEMYHKVRHSCSSSCG